MTAAGQRSGATPEKSDRAFRTISEVSGELDIPQHVLRFWETRFTQVRPIKRGGGRRLYRPDHIALLRGIRALLYDDAMTIKGVQKILREKGVKAVIGRGAGGGGLGIQQTPPEDAAERLAAIRSRLEQEETAPPPEDTVQAEAGDRPTPDAARVRATITKLERVLARLEG